MRKLHATAVLKAVCIALTPASMVFAMTPVSSHDIELAVNFVSTAPMVCAFIGCMAVHFAAHRLVAARFGATTPLPWLIPGMNIIGVWIYIDSFPQGLRSAKQRVVMTFAGPLAGLVAALALFALELPHCEIVAPDESSILLGDPVVVTMLTRLVVGPLEPGNEILLSPLALAGVAGITLSGSHLFPIYPLDGAYLWEVLFGRRHAMRIGIALCGVLLVVQILVTGDSVLMAVVLLGLQFLHAKRPVRFAQIFGQGWQDDETTDPIGRPWSLLLATVALATAAVCCVA